MAPNSRSSSLFADPPAAPDSPGDGWVTAHCDGGARGNPGPAGYGAVLRGADGALLAELSEFLGVCSNNVAEYRGLLGCLGWALQHGVKRLRVISDSDLMVKQIQGKYRVASPDLRPLWEQARQSIAGLERFEIAHALRHKNKDADRLANEAMDRGMGRSPASGAAGSAVTLANSPAAPRGESAPRAGSASMAKPATNAKANPAASGTMRRGFTRGGVVELLGGEPLPDGLFVKIVVE